jgi:hypothetical protein
MGPVDEASRGLKLPSTKISQSKAVAIVNKNRRLARKHIVRVQVIDGHIIGAGMPTERRVAGDDNCTATVGKQRHSGLEVAGLDPLTL